MDLTNLESTILRFLEAHQGKEFAISRRDLVEKINSAAVLQCCGSAVNGNTATQQHSNTLIHEREIRRVIKHLVESHGQWIGSCTKGYFMIQTDQELLGACKYYHGYALSLLHVEAKLRKMSLPALLGQLSLEFSSRLNRDATK